MTHLGQGVRSPAKAKDEDYGLVRCVHVHAFAMLEAPSSWGLHHMPSKCTRRMHENVITGVQQLLSQDLDKWLLFGRGYGRKFRCLWLFRLAAAILLNTSGASLKPLTSFLRFSCCCSDHPGALK